MTWVIVYLICSILTAITAGICQTSGEQYIRLSRSDMYTTIAFVLVWPITIFILIPLSLLILNREERLSSLAEACIARMRNSDDLEGIGEKQLKAVLACHKENFKWIDQRHAMRAKQELEDRAAEKILLGNN